MSENDESLWTADRVREWADELRNEREAGAAFSLDKIADEIDALTEENARLTAQLNGANESLGKQAIALAERLEADQALVDKYRDPWKGHWFSFPGDVAAIIRKFDAEVARLTAQLAEREEALRTQTDLLARLETAAFNAYSFEEHEAFNEAAATIRRLTEERDNLKRAVPGSPAQARQAPEKGGEG